MIIGKIFANIIAILFSKDDPDDPLTKELIEQEWVNKLAAKLNKEREKQYA